MSIIGYVLLSLAFYVCGIIATYTCITVTPILFRNGLSRRYPLHMSFLFPISLLLNIVPRGFRVFFLACFIIQCGSLITWGILCVAFIFLPYSWWYFFGFVSLSIMLGFCMPKNMREIVSSIGTPYKRCYYPKD